MNTTNHLRRSAGAVAVSLLLLGLTGSAQPFTAPGGQWDIVMSGTRSGVAQMTFNDDGTITMSEVLVPRIPSVNSDHTATDSRGSGGDDSRGGPLPDPNVLPPHSDLHGFFSSSPSDSDINFTNSDGNAFWEHGGQSAGRWGFDSAGRLIGFFSEVSAPSSVTTNLVPIGTNVVNGTNITLYLTNVEFIRITNSINFAGKASLNADPLKSRLTLLVSTPAGKSTFTGLRSTGLPDMEGSWFGEKHQQGLPYIEFFNLRNPDSLFTSYVEAGQGAEYLTQGAFIMTRQKKFGFAARIVQPHNPPIPPEQDILVVRAVTGSIDYNRAKLSGQGLEGSAGARVAVTFKAARNTSSN